MVYWFHPFIYDVNDEIALNFPIVIEGIGEYVGCEVSCEVN